MNPLIAMLSTFVYVSEYFLLHLYNALSLLFPRMFSFLGWEWRDLLYLDFRKRPTVYFQDLVRDNVCQRFLCSIDEQKQLNSTMGKQWIWFKVWWGNLVWPNGSHQRWRKFTRGRKMAEAYSILWEGIKDTRREILVEK